MLLTIVASACNSPVPYVPPTSITWSDCGGGFQCGTVAVPLDYSNTRGDTIKLALIRKPATEPTHRIGALVTNPGGPGLSGVEFLRQSATSFVRLNTRFDLIGFDPRGVGQSAPVRCASGKEMDASNTIDYQLDDAGEKQVYIHAVQAYARACRQKNARILPFVDTVSTAKDMEIIRFALGDAKLTYLGISYGTFLGETYAHLYPTRIRALVLDAVVDPAVSPMDAILPRAAGFEDNLQAFLAYCRAFVGCLYAREADPGARLADLMQRLDLNPLPVGTRMLTKTLAMSVVLATLYFPRFWVSLEEALYQVDQGDGHSMLTLSDLFNGRHANGSYTNTADANNAIRCLDRPVPSDIASYDGLGPALAKASPLLGPALQYGLLICSYWPIKPKGAVGPLSANGAPPILLIGATQDPATPYAFAEAVNKQITGSVLLTRKGYGHPSYDKSFCVRQAVAAYLIDLTLPAPGTVCDSEFP